jgi:REP element-mobilizing transposase RayT
MARPLRLEFPGATYHVTSRGDRREAIYRDDADRSVQLQIITAALARFDARVLAYCLMGNHYHLVLHTRQANLSRLMRQINGVYTQAFNRRHGLVGHLFQGRFKAILVDRDAYLMSLCRYVERNPVAAGLVWAPGEWAWSSYRAHAGLAEVPPWLDTQALHAQLLGRPPRDAVESARAAHLYAALAAQAPGVSLWQGNLTAQIFLGDGRFVARMQALASVGQSQTTEIPRAQRLPSLSLPQCLEHCGGRRAQALRMAHVEGGLTMSSLAREIGLSVSRVSRLIAAAERGVDSAEVRAKDKA